MILENLFDPVSLRPEQIEAFKLIELFNMAECNIQITDEVKTCLDRRFSNWSIEVLQRRPTRPIVSSGCKGTCSFGTEQNHISIFIFYLSIRHLITKAYHNVLILVFIGHKINIPFLMIMNNRNKQPDPESLNNRVVVLWRLVDFSVHESCLRWTEVLNNQA